MKKIFWTISIVVFLTSELFGQPHFAIAPPSLDFGPVNVGQISILQATVSNDGTTPLEISGITSSDGQFTFVPNIFPITVPVGGDQVFDVTFSPTSLGSFTATLSFFHNGVNVSSPFDYSVDGIGFDEGPMFVATPTSLNFGTVYVGNTNTKYITITNYSFTNTLNISSVTTTNSDFSVIPTTATIPPGENQVFDVTFSPTSIGSFSENVIFTHNGPTSPNLVPVYGESISAAAVDIPFTFFDGINTDTNLRVGLDSTATYGIDTLLGEVYVPTHLPPPGIIWLWLNLDSLELATYRDYRYAPSFPYSGTHIHKIDGYLSTGATEFTMFYNFPQGVTANVKDPFGGTLFNQDLSDSGSYSFPFGVYYPYVILTMYYDIVIPVELTSFTASVVQNENAVQLNWTTATEINNSGFEIQRTSPLPSPYQGEGGEAGGGWEKIGFVPGFGTTTEPKSYSFIDEDITTGTYKYRLKQIDFDGSFEYSNEIEVEVDFTPKEFVLHQNYPNPFNPITTIKFEIPDQARNDNVLVTLKVYDILGNEVATLVNEEKEPGVYTVEHDSHSDEGQNLSSGIYFYQLNTRSFRDTKKMILLR